MPRTGKRPGANRPDALVPTVPVQPAGQPNGTMSDNIPRVAGNQPYGEAGQQQADIQAAPTAQPGSPQSTSPQTIAQMYEAHGRQHPQLTPLDAPTERPGEHVTTGNLNSGSPLPAVRSLNATGGQTSALLNQLADISGIPELANLASIAAGAGQ